MKKNVFFLLILSFLFSCGNNHDLSNIQSISDDISGKYIPDKRVGIFDVDYKMSGNDLVVKGITTSADAKQDLLARLQNEGYSPIDSLTVLPDDDLMNGKTYGVINLSVANLRRESDFSSEMVTQALLGMPVRVLQHDGWYQIQTPDDYISWVHRAGVYPMTKEEYNAWNEADKIVITSHYGFTYEKPDVNSQSVSDVVAGNRLKYEGTEKDFYKVSYPDGKTAYVSKTISMPISQWRASLKTDAGSIIKTGRTLLGVPYLWAGTSSKGIDCSGFVRTVLFLHDIIIPRDASQQAYVGQHIDIAPDFGNLVPGDLIFFGRKATAERKERVVHVGIYIGAKRFIHSQGDVRINSFDPNHEEYDEYNLNRLLFATRILNVAGEPKINTTLTNPYYLPQQ